MRAFVGVPILPERALAALLEDLRVLDADLNVVPNAQLHVTLSFLGDVAEDESLANELDAATRGVQAWKMRLRGVDAFPNARHPKIVWAGLSETQALANLAARVRARLPPADDKPFRAHVTLARLKSPRGEAAVSAFLREHANDDWGEVPASVARVYRSQLSREGPSYAVLHESALEA